jgi:hypothetical protein
LFFAKDKAGGLLALCHLADNRDEGPASPCESLFYITRVSDLTNLLHSHCFTSGGKSAFIATKGSSAA